MFIGSWGRGTGTRGRHVAEPARPDCAVPVSGPARQPAASLPDGTVDMETEARLALTALEESARRRFVELQMAVEPFLTAQADMHECQRSLRALMAGAISRAESGVLVTAMRRGDSVNVEILDDGIAACSAVDLPNGSSLPQGATVAVESLPEQGTKVLLRLRHARIVAAEPQSALEIIH